MQEMKELLMKIMHTRLNVNFKMINLMKIMYIQLILNLKMRMKSKMFSYNKIWNQNSK